VHIDLSIINLYRYSEFEDCLVRSAEIVGTLTVDLEFERTHLSNSNKMNFFECERENEPIEDKKKILELMVSKNSR
jgi:hypothetical protein